MATPKTWYEIDNPDVLYKATGTGTYKKYNPKTFAWEDIGTLPAGYTDWNDYFSQNTDKFANSESTDNVTPEDNTSLFTGANTNDLFGIKSTPVTQPSNTGSANNAAVSMPDFLTKSYQADLKNLDKTKKFLTANAIGQGLLNIENLKQAWAKMPTSVSVGTIPNVEYPSIIAPGLADINNVMGKYRSVARRTAAELGYNPVEVLRGVDANATNAELAARAELASKEAANKIAETTANTAITEQNVANKYTSDVARQTREDEIAKNRSALVTAGLTNLGKIGTDLGSSLLGLRGNENVLNTQYQYLQNLQNAATEDERNKWLSLLMASYGSGGTSTSNVPFNAAQFLKQ